MKERKEVSESKISQNYGLSQKDLEKARRDSILSFSKIFKKREPEQKAE